MRTALLILGLVTSAVGCGDGAAGYDFAPPFATLHGQITMSGSGGMDNVRAALAWYTAKGGDRDRVGAHPIMVSQDVPVSSSFPAAFRLEITQLPPAASLRHPTTREMAEYGLSPDSAWAMGVMLVYQDQNRNGQLDFTPATSPEIADRLIGYTGDKQGSVTSNYLVFYWEGPLPTPAYAKEMWNTPTSPIGPGFTLERGEHDASKGPATVYPQVVPMDTFLEVKVKGEPRLSCYLVEPPTADLPADHLDQPFAVEVFACTGNQPYPGDMFFCYPGVNWYVSRRPAATSPAIEELCGPSEEQCLVWADPATQDGDQPVPKPLPAGWPCP